MSRSRACSGSRSERLVREMPTGRDARGRPAQPERLAEAVGRFADEVAPETPQAEVQTVWAGAVGDRIAAVTTVSEEREGVVYVECESAVWAEELGLMEARIRESLNDALEARGGPPVERLSFRSA